MEDEFIRNRDFVVFGLQPWDIQIGSNCKNMALEFCKNNRVLYVNRPLDRISFYSNRNNSQVQKRFGAIKAGSNIPDKINDNLWVLNPNVLIESINWLPHNFIYTFLNKRNNKKLAEQIDHACAGLGFKDIILFVDNDFFNGLYLKELLQPKLFVYYIRDYLLSQRYFSNHGKIAEPAIMKKADIIVANSQYLSNYGSRYNSRSFDVGQGCEVDDFAKKPSYIPLDIVSIDKPVLGYCGLLSATRLDIDLIVGIALANPHWNIVLVGPEDDLFRQSDLHHMKNVYFTGRKQPAELPAYIHHFDVCLNPQVLNEMTRGNYPRKVDEYLAAGKPVVATATETMQLFKECTFLCNNLNEYCIAIETALLESNMADKIEQRIKISRSHTWEASVKKMYRIINNINN